MTGESLEHQKEMEIRDFEARIDSMLSEGYALWNGSDWNLWEMKNSILCRTGYTLLQRQTQGESCGGMSELLSVSQTAFYDRSRTGSRRPCWEIISSADFPVI